MKICMSRHNVLTFEFVRAIPERLENNTLYISMDYATAAHRCCCGCGKEVVTPLSPTDWKLTYDGVSVSLFPSIGNWSFECRSHYWIDKNRVRWAEDWTEDQIEAGRAHDRRLKGGHYEGQSSAGSRTPPAPPSQPGKKPRGLRAWLSKWWD